MSCTCKHVPLRDCSVLNGIFINNKYRHNQKTGTGMWSQRSSMKPLRVTRSPWWPCLGWCRASHALLTLCRWSRASHLAKEVPSIARTRIVMIALGIGNITRGNMFRHSHRRLVTSLASRLARLAICAPFTASWMCARAVTRRPHSGRLSQVR
jgi:hypothetical protein